MNLRSIPVWLAGTVALVGALALPFLLNGYMVKVLIMAFVYVGLAVGLNLITGVAGQFNLAHAAFFGTGAYTAALLAVNFKMPFWICVVAGAAMSAVLGLILGLPTIRLREVYLTVTTLGFGEVVRLILLNWISVTRGPMGVPGIPLPTLFGYKFVSLQSQYYLILGLLVPTIYVFWRLSYSPFGMVLRAIRENEVAAKTLGVNPVTYKLSAFTIGAGFAGLMGSFYAFHAAFISPDNFQFAESITLLSMVVVGGLGSMPGAIIGALVLAIAPESLRFMAQYRMIVFGALMLAMVLLRPQGLFSEALSVAWATGRAKLGKANQGKGATTDAA